VRVPKKPRKASLVKSKARKPAPKAKPKGRAAKKSSGKKRGRPKSLKELSNNERLKVLSESKQNLRESSFHEAGHAVWTFLDGRLDSIEAIEIGYRDGAVGEIRWGYQIYSHKIGLPRVLRSPNCFAASCIACSFSGWACEYIYTKEDDPWERVLEEWFGNVDRAMKIPAAERPWMCDFEKAAEIALLHLNLRGRPLDSLGEEPMALLEEVWEWTIELFRLPQVWKVVNTLAKELIGQAPGTMAGTKAQRIIRGAWKGPPKQVPMAHLGVPWVDRFGIEAGVNRPF
jgi:hypothetical protein